MFATRRALAEPVIRGKVASFLDNPVDPLSQDFLQIRIIQYVLFASKLATHGDLHAFPQIREWAQLSPNEQSDRVYELFQSVCIKAQTVLSKEEYNQVLTDKGGLFNTETYVELNRVIQDKAFMILAAQGLRLVSPVQQLESTSSVRKFLNNPNNQIQLQAIKTLYLESLGWLPPEIGLFTNLEYLYLIGKQVSDAGLENLAGLGNLHSLYLSGTQISDAGLEHLAGLGTLHFLDLNDTQISDAGLENLAGLGTLHTLFLNDTQISDAGLENLAGLGNLHTLLLSDTQISDAGLENLAGLGNLHTLFLNDTQISDAGLEHLAGLGNLLALYLSGTQVSDAGLKHLAGLDKLRSLNLSGTQISDAGLENLAGLDKLRSLDLRDTQISDVGLKHLAGLGNLQTLDLRGTQVSDAGQENLAHDLLKITPVRIVIRWD